MIFRQMFFQILGQLFTGSLRHRYQVLNPHRFIDLSTNTLCYYCYFQPFTSRVDSSCRTGRTSTGYQYIIFFCLNSFQFHRTVTGFQLLQQIPHTATPHMNLFTISKYSRNGLYFHPFYFFFIYRSIYCLMAYLTIQKYYHIQSLNHIGTIGTGERQIGGQTNRPL